MHQSLMNLLFPAPKYTWELATPHELIYLDCKDRKIPCGVFENSEAAYTFIYFHGNGYDIANSIQIMNILIEILKHPCNTICVEYPGYGYYRKTPTDFSIIEEDAVAACTYARQKYSQTKIIVIGRSMGTAPACFLASLNLPDAVVLISPFVTLAQFIEDNKEYFNDQQLSQDHFNNLMRISSATIPIVIVHGKADQLIPCEHSEKLFKEIKSHYKRIYLPENMTHNNVYQEEAVILALIELIDNSFKEFKQIQ